MPIFPIGHQIENIAGLLEQEDNHIHAKHYSAVMMLDSGVMALLAQNGCARVQEIPDDTSELPAQFIDCEETVVGSQITGAFVLHKPNETNFGRNGPQLFLVLDHERLMGLVPTQRGTVLHVERILSSPLIRQNNTLMSLANEPTTIDELIGY